MTRAELRLEALKLAVACGCADVAASAALGRTCGVDLGAIEGIADRYLAYVERADADAARRAAYGLDFSKRPSADSPF